MKLLLALLVLVAAVAAQRDERLFHTRQFWDGVERGISEAGAEVQRRLSNNLETAMDRLATIGQNIGTISRRIEDQVYFRGDADGEELPEPHIIPGDASLLLEAGEPFGAHGGSDRDAEVLPPRTGGPLFDINSRFPHFPVFARHPLLWVGAIPQPWWKGDNVCVEEEEINEDEHEPLPSITKAPTTTTAATTEATEQLEATTHPDNKLRKPEEIPEADGEVAGGDRVARFMFGEMEVRSCSDSRDRYTCTTRIRRRGISKTVRQMYRCCHGYVRENNGCTQVNLVTVPESLEGLGLTDFLSLSKAAGIVDVLGTLNLTVFAPSNEAIQDYTADRAHDNDLDITDNEVYRRKRAADDDAVEHMINSHLHEGFLYTGDFRDEQVLKTLAPSSSIRINIYRQTVPPIMTANCARITTANQHSSNGVIHTLDRVLQPATLTIADVISSDPQFTTLKKLVSASGLLPQLRQEGQYTLLAPTDAAFAALTQQEVDRLLSAEACLPSVLKNHLLPNVICSAAVTSPEAKTINLLDKYLKVRLDGAGKLFVEDAQIVAKDIMATNGVIHIIDAPLLPTEAKPVLQVLQERNLTRFLQLLQEAELADEVQALQDVTLFAPSNDALSRIADEEMEALRSNKESLREALRYHVTTAPLQARNISNNMHMDTLSGHALRVNLYSRPAALLNLFLPAPFTPRVLMTAACGAVSLQQESRACGASVHVVEALLLPPRHSVTQHLQATPEFSIFAKIINESSLAEELSGAGPFTVLAPTDHVFKTLPQSELDSLLEDEQLKDELVKRHVLKEHMCCEGIFPSTHLSTSGVQSRTAQGTTLHLHRTNGGLLKAGSARITACSPSLSNGLVHTVNRLYVEPHIPAQHSMFHDNRRHSVFSFPLFGHH